MNASILRLLWSVVFETFPERMSEVAYEPLLQQVMGCIKGKTRLNEDERIALEAYLRTKKPLILEVVYG